MNHNTAAGPDGVHPALQKAFDIDDSQDKEKLFKILLSSLTMKDFFSSRVTLLPKKQTGQYRPIQVQNFPLRLLEKKILQQVRQWNYSNKDDIFGFVPNRETSDAYDRIQNILLKEPEVPLVFWTTHEPTTRHLGRS